MDVTGRISIKVDAGKSIGLLQHNWKYIGYDENNYTHTPEGEELIAKFGRLGDGPYYFRTHHMLCTGNLHGIYKWGSTNAYTEDESGNPVYNWETVDRILDVYHRNNGKPFFELGFMPFHLVDPKHFEGMGDWQQFEEYKKTFWSYPPKDYQKWYDLIFNLVRHCVDRYGEAEVLTWYWELWNEPDIFYWRGTPEEFFKLFDYTEAAVHAVLEGAKLGGPGTTDPNPGANSLMFMEAFLDHCANGLHAITGEKGIRLDFATFHTKGGGFPFKLNAPKDTPSIRKQVSQVKTGLEALNRYGYGSLEVVLSEADPDGWAAGGQYDNQNMNFRNTEYYASYVACGYHQIERVARSMQADVRPLAWAFLFRGERCFEGTRTFTTQGIDKAVLNAFKMFARMGTRELGFASSGENDVLAYRDNFGTGETPDISGMASTSDDGRLQILIYSHHDDCDIESEADIELHITGISLQGPVLVKHARIDASHSNAYAEWVSQGKPDYPNDAQYADIKSRDKLELLTPPVTVIPTDGKLSLSFTLPAHAVSLLELSAG